MTFADSSASTGGCDVIAFPPRCFLRPKDRARSGGAEVVTPLPSRPRGAISAGETALAVARLFYGNLGAGTYRRMIAAADKAWLAAETREERDKIEVARWFIEAARAGRRRSPTPKNQ